MCAGNIINESKDFEYTGSDIHQFPLCCWCLAYTPFLFYVTSKNALASIQKFLPPKLNVFCAECLPKESEDDNSTARPFYDMECLFNSQEFIDLFRGYRYNNPYYAEYSSADRIVIIEQAKISPRYKELMRKSLPTLVKMRKIQELFPSVHRMRFQKHASGEAVFLALRDKSREIWQYYNNASTASLHDNYDVVIDRTPMHLKQRSERRIPNDTLMMRSVASPEDSASEYNSIGHLSSEHLTINEELRPILREVVSSQEASVPDVGSQPTEPNISSQSQSPNISSQSNDPNIISLSAVPDISSQSTVPNISSQSIQQTIGSQLSVSSFEEQVPEEVEVDRIPDPSVSSSPSTGNVSEDRRTVSVRRRGNTVFHDSQEAGPSGLQHQQPQPRRQQQTRDTVAKAKRRRTSPHPVNPSPTDFQTSNQLTRHGVRYPRLHGG